MDEIATLHAAIFGWALPVFGLHFITIQADPELKPVQGRIVELELPAPKLELPDATQG